MEHEEETVLLLIKKALSKAQDEHKTREMALVVTKLQEAEMWTMEHLKALRAAAARIGFGAPQT